AEFKRRIARRPDESEERLREGRTFPYLFPGPAVQRDVNGEAAGKVEKVLANHVRHATNLTGDAEVDRHLCVRLLGIIAPAGRDIPVVHERPVGLMPDAADGGNGEDRAEDWRCTG